MPSKAAFSVSPPTLLAEELAHRLLETRNEQTVLRVLRASGSQLHKTDDARAFDKKKTEKKALLGK